MQRCDLPEPVLPVQIASWLYMQKKFALQTPVVHVLRWAGRLPEEVRRAAPPGSPGPLFWPPARVGAAEAASGRTLQAGVWSHIRQWPAVRAVRLALRVRISLLVSAHASVYGVQPPIADVAVYASQDLSKQVQSSANRALLAVDWPPPATPAGAAGASRHGQDAVQQPHRLTNREPSEAARNYWHSSAQPPLKYRLCVAACDETWRA